MTSYLPPSGYRTPNQAYSRFGYSSLSYLPALIGKNRAVLPGVSSEEEIISLASYLPGAYNSIQTNLGLTYGGSLRPAASNTATATVALGGTLTGQVAVPIQVKATNSLAIGSGGTVNVYYDGGTTPIQSGLAPSAGVPIPLSGAASGLYITLSAGTLVNNNTWDATCAALADQTVGAVHWSEATALLQPIIGVGVNGIPSLKFGIGAEKLTSLLNMPAPGTTPWAMAAVLRMNTYVGSGRMIGGVSAVNTGMLWMASTTPNLGIFNTNSVGISNQLPVGTWGAVNCAFTNSAADYCRPGTGPGVTGASAGNSVSTGRRIGFDGTNPVGVFELLALAHVPVQSMTAWRAGVTAMFGGTVAV